MRIGGSVVSIWQTRCRIIPHSRRTDTRCPAADMQAKSAEKGRFRDGDLLRHLFEATVALCIADGLVSSQRFAADASLIEADANKQNSTPKEDWDRSAIDPADAPRAVREYLDVLDDAAFGVRSRQTRNPGSTAGSGHPGAAPWAALSPEHASCRLCGEPEASLLDRYASAFCGSPCGPRARP